MMNLENENPFLSPEEKGADTKTRFFTTRRILFWCVSALIIGLLIVAMLLPAVRQVREPARRAQCQNNLRQIMLALHHYASIHGSLPPAYTVDENGKPLHSWRTLILPYLEQNQLYESIDLTRPWDDPVNAHARETNLHIYRCPSVLLQPGFTTYLGNAWEKGVFGIGGEGRKLEDFTDGTSKTVAVLEVPDEMAVEWMSPHDLYPEMLMKIAEQTTASPHPGITNIATADGAGHSVKLFDSKTQPEDKHKRMERLKPFLTINSGEKESLSDLD